MKFSKDLIKGVCIGVVSTVLLSSSIIYAAEIFKTSGEASYDVVNLAVGNNSVPRSQMPDQMPPIMIDQRTYVPLRAAVNAVGGDVIWNADTKTAAVMIADTLQIRKNGNIVFGIQRYSDPLQFAVSVSPDFLVPLKYYDTRWVIEKDGVEAESWDVGSVMAIKNEGFTFQQYCDYKFPDGGTYTIKFNMKRAGTAQWLTVSQKKIVVE